MDKLKELVGVKENQVFNLHLDTGSIITYKVYNDCLYCYNHDNDTWELCNRDIPNVVSCKEELTLDKSFNL